MTEVSLETPAQAAIAATAPTAALQQLLQQLLPRFLPPPKGAI